MKLDILAAVILLAFVVASFAAFGATLRLFLVWCALVAAPAAAIWWACRRVYDAWLRD